MAKADASDHRRRPRRARRRRQAPASRIAARRISAQLTQKRLAELTGIPLRQIQRYDQGRVSEPRLRQLVNIAAVLKCPISEICEPEWLEWTAYDQRARRPPG